MLTRMKRTMVAGAIVAVGALAGASGASADQWYANGTVVGGAGVDAVAAGFVSIHQPLGGGATMTTNCEVSADVNLSNPGGVAGGHVTSFGVVPSPSDCSVTSSPAGIIGDCELASFVPNITTPWALGSSASNVTMSGVDYVFGYGTRGSNPCALAAALYNAKGGITGSWANGSASPAEASTWSFTNAAGLLVNGSLPVTVNGSVEVVGTAGESITLEP